MSAEVSNRRSVSAKGDDDEKPGAAASGGGEIKLEAKMSLVNGITVIVGSIIGSGQFYSFPKIIPRPILNLKWSLFV